MGHNLEYWIGKRHIETLMTNKPKPMCYAKLKELVKAKLPAYKLGLFKITLSA